MNSKQFSELPLLRNIKCSLSWLLFIFQLHLKHRRLLLSVAERRDQDLKTGGGGNELK